MKLRKLSNFALMTIVALTALAVTGPVFGKASDLTVEDFFRNAEFSSMTLSPSGKYLAILSPIEGHRNIVVLDTATLGNPKPLTGYDKADVAGFFWASDDRIVYTMDDDGNESFSLYSVNRDGRPKTNTLVQAIAPRSAAVINSLPEDPDHIIVQYNGRFIEAPDLFKVPVDSKVRGRSKKNPDMEMIARNPGDVTGWIVDHDGEVRGAVSIDGVNGKFHYKDKGEEDFRVVEEFHVHDEGWNPLAFDFDNKTMYVASNIGRDTAAVYTYDTETHELGEMLYAHDEVDVTGLIMSRERKKLLGVSYFTDYPQDHYFDKEEERLMNGLKAAFPDREVDVVSTNLKETLHVLLVWDDQDPGKYYLFDRKTNQVKYLAAQREWLDPELMSEMKPIKFESRDGLTIRGYITIPKGTDGKNLPLIVNPHGGPFGVRDAWGFNSEHQFFASRGYATVQVNYRGSGGYGRKFQQAGHGGKWGGEMQHDITDAVKYLVDEGIADPDRVCIYGGSYGGYATMAGLTFTPDLYQCGINYVGVTDVALLFESMPKAWEPMKEVMKVEIGDPKDKALMDKMSPLAHADKIKAPVMIVHGKNDPRVVYEHATKLRSAMEKNGVKFNDDNWVVKGNEGHGFRKEENRLELYEKMEKFLAKHLNP
ncbi:MAG: S9 family peptidase [Xanthomonadales bacterium]|nr:S9 family peptidase [Xanthomonadales bacterium]